MREPLGSCCVVSLAMLSPEEPRIDDVHVSGVIRAQYRRLLNLPDPALARLSREVVKKESAIRIAATAVHEVVNHHYGTAVDRRESIPGIMAVLDDVEQDWPLRFEAPVLEYLVDYLYATAFCDIVQRDAPRAMRTIMEPLTAAEISLVAD